MGHNGKEAIFAAKMAASATAWGTEQALGANCGIKIGSIDFPFGEPNYKIDETIDTPEPDNIDFGNLKEPEFGPEPHPRFVYTNALDPLTQILMACLYSGTTVAASGGDGLYLHTGTIASNHAIASEVSRWLTLGLRDKGESTNDFLTIPSWQPGGFEWTSEKDSWVKLALKGIGNKVLRNSATNGDTQFNAVTYTESARRVHHKHLRGAAGATDGVWMKSYTASQEGGAQISPFTQAANLVSPDMLSIGMDRKHEPLFTDSESSDQPCGNGYNEYTVKLRFPKKTDALSSLFDAALEKWKGNPAAADQTFFLFRARYTFPTVLAGTSRGYFEFGLPKLVPVSSKMKVDAGKRNGVEYEFKGLRPPSSSHLPNNFLYVGGTAGAAFDAIYLAIANAYATAYIS